MQLHAQMLWTLHGLARQMPNLHVHVSLCAVFLTPLLWFSSAVGTNELFEHMSLECGTVSNHSRERLHSRMHELLLTTQLLSLLSTLYRNWLLSDWFRNERG